MITFRNVYKTYPSGVTALVDINLVITKGEFILLCGSNGAGKTTFLNLINRYQLPTKGEVFVFGRNLNKMRAWEIPYLRRRLGVIFQDFKLLQNKTVSENLLFVMQVLGVARKEAIQRVEEALANVSLEQKKDLYPASLSFGEQQRLNVARALLSQPEIILADEPCASLDEKTSADILQLLLASHAKGATLIYATQGTDPAPSIPKRVLYLENGKIAELTNQ